MNLLSVHDMLIGHIEYNMQSVFKVWALSIQWILQPFKAVTLKVKATNSLFNRIP